MQHFPPWSWRKILTLNLDFCQTLFEENNLQIFFVFNMDCTIAHSWLDRLMRHIWGLSIMVYLVNIRPGLKFLSILSSRSARRETLSWIWLFCLSGWRKQFSKYFFFRSFSQLSSKWKMHFSGLFYPWRGRGCQQWVTRGPAMCLVSCRVHLLTLPAICSLHSANNVVFSKSATLLFILIMPKAFFFLTFSCSLQYRAGKKICAISQQGGKKQMHIFMPRSVLQRTRKSEEKMSHGITNTNNNVSNNVRIFLLRSVFLE